MTRHATAAVFRAGKFVLAQKACWVRGRGSGPAINDVRKRDVATVCQVPRDLFSFAADVTRFTAIRVNSDYVYVSKYAHALFGYIRFENRAVRVPNRKLITIVFLGYPFFLQVRSRTARFNDPRWVLARRCKVHHRVIAAQRPRLLRNQIRWIVRRPHQQRLSSRTRFQIGLKVRIGNSLILQSQGFLARQRNAIFAIDHRKVCIQLPLAILYQRQRGEGCVRALVLFARSFDRAVSADAGNDSNQQQAEKASSKEGHPLKRRNRHRVAW